MGTETMVKCGKCGGDIPDLKFCDQCGAALKNAAAAVGPAAGAASPTPTAFRPRTDQELLQDAVHGRADEVVAEYLSAGKVGELLPAFSRALSNHPQEALIYCLSLLRAGDYETAWQLLKDMPERGEKHHKIRSALRKVTSLRRGGTFFVGQQSYGERLALANEFTAIGLHAEAIGMLTEDVIEAAGREETDAYAVAEHFQAANKPSLLLERVTRKERPAELYANYAHVLHLFGANEASLALLEKAKTLPPQGYEVLVAVHRSLGTLHKLEPNSIPDVQRILLVQGLLEEGQPEAALAALQGIPRVIWRSREYGVVLRLLQRLGRYSDALGLYSELSQIAPLGHFPDVHWYFALLCEKAGQFERAKTVLREIMARHGAYRDAAERLKNLEAIPAEETSRVTTVLSIATRAAMTNTDIAVFIKNLEEKEHTGLIGERFIIVKHLGVGGMGVVYKARDLRLNRDVALKRLRGELAKDPAARARFLDEAKTLSTLAHPNIVAIHDMVESADATYLVFECVEGETIHELLTVRGPFAPHACVGVLRQICAALAHAHSRGVVHRDLKPANVMVAGGRLVKVMDFGLASRMEPGSVAETGEAGTPAYMAPEQHAGQVSSQSDIYAFGATAYEMLTGRMPFTGGDVRRMKGAEAYEPLPPGIPGRLTELVVRCLKADPAARPSGVAEVDRELAAVFAATAAAVAPA